LTFLKDGISCCLSAIIISISSVELTPGGVKFNINVSVPIPPPLAFGLIVFNITLMDQTFGGLQFKVDFSSLSWMDGGIKAKFLIICTWNN
ncbi:hypothetical protein XENOCAPTIV_016205, partial [Xenoophorus captivus]